MPTALIADDEGAPREQLLMALAGVWPELQVVHECANGVDAWDAFLEFEPQVCFLDVRMPGFTGIEVAQRIGPSAHVVFVAAHGDHALAAFDEAAVDCVLKPFEADEVARAVQRVKTRLADPAAAPADLLQLLNRLVGQVRKPAPLEFVEAGAGKDARPVPVADIVYFEAEGRYTRAVCSNGDGGELLIRTPLKELLAQLDPAHFRQVHRSIVVDPRRVAGAVRADGDRMLLTLHGRTEQLPVARRFQGLFDAR